MTVSPRQGQSQARQPGTRQLHCACCGRPFSRPSMRGPKPLYCSADCQKQMRVRSRMWSQSRHASSAAPIRRAS